jgi:putative heme-binding domain-containing protein
VAIVFAIGLGVFVTRLNRRPALQLAEGWRAELIAEAPEILFPTAIVQAPDGTLYVGQDPMDMPGPPTAPADSVVAIRAGKVSVFADKLWAVMGLEWLDDTLYVVHAPYLSAFRDTNSDGKADERTDLITGLGPPVPGFNGLNDHIASGLRLGIDGFLYIAIGDKGIPHGVARDGTTIQLQGGGVIRIRPDGSDLEVVSTGERNPLSVALSATDEIFTYGNDDDSKAWPNSLTHHVVGGHYGYPYEFSTRPDRALPIMDGRLGGAGAQGLCYNESGLPDLYVGNLFFCDWGLGAVTRYEIERSGASYQVKSREYLVRKGTYRDFRPFSLAVGDEGRCLYLVDWAFNGFLADGPRTGRLFRLTHSGSPGRETPRQVERVDIFSALKNLGDPALSIRRQAQRWLSAHPNESEGPLRQMLDASIEREARSRSLVGWVLTQQGRSPVSAGSRPSLRRIGSSETASVCDLSGNRCTVEHVETQVLHALWALDAIDTPGARSTIRTVLASDDPLLASQAARSSGIRRDRLAVPALAHLLTSSSPLVRREASIALGAIGDSRSTPALLAALGDPDPVVSWSVRHAIRRIGEWDVEALARVLQDPSRRDDALRLCDQVWSVPVVRALTGALAASNDPAWRGRLTDVVGGLYRRYPDWSGAWYGSNPVANAFPRRTRDWDPEGMETVLHGLILALHDSDGEVRRRAIVGLSEVGERALPRLRDALEREDESGNIERLADALADAGDSASIPNLVRLLEPARSLAIRTSALKALEVIDTTESRDARKALLVDPSTPEELLALAIPGLGRSGAVSFDELSRYLKHSSPAIRAAALRGLTHEHVLSSGARKEVVACLDDPSNIVRRAAIVGVAALNLRESMPTLLELVNDPHCRPDAIAAVAAMPDPRALSIYLEAISDRDPDVRKAGEIALIAVRNSVSDELKASVRSGRFTGQAGTILERLTSHFEPPTDWRVIGPFPHTTPPLFANSSLIEFDRPHVGVEGRTIVWASRRGDHGSGRLSLDDLKGGMGDRGGFGHDDNTSPDLAAFAYAEIASEQERPAFLLVGSSGTITIKLNDKLAFHADHEAGRPYVADSDLVRITLRKGRNRILVRTRQGIGRWTFSLQFSSPSDQIAPSQSLPPSIEERRTYALGHEGDARRGESLFFEPGGIGCGKCHSVGRRGLALVGPNLSGIAHSYDRSELIRSVLEPSARIAAGYQPTVIARDDGSVITGVVRAETEAALELTDAGGTLFRIPKSEIEARRLGNVSLMPTGLADSLTPAEFADLIAYLMSLRSGDNLPVASRTVVPGASR